MKNEMILFNEGVKFEKVVNTDNTVFIFTVKNKMNMIKTGIFNGNEKIFFSSPVLMCPNQPVIHPPTYGLGIE